MKIVFEGRLRDRGCPNCYVDLGFDGVKQDIEQELRRIIGKHVRVTIEDIKEPIKGTPVCYAAAEVA